MSRDPADERTLTPGKLQVMLDAASRVPPDPLNGARRLFAHENRIDDARELAAAYNEGPFRRLLIVEKSPFLPPGFIMGTNGLGDICLIIRPDDVPPAASIASSDV